MANFNKNLKLRGYIDPNDQTIGKETEALLAKSKALREKKHRKAQ